ncbi:MAG: TolC family protein [Holophagae bacterium]|nr:TolC family protein [Holophagae bacterium]
MKLKRITLLIAGWAAVSAPLCAQQTVANAIDRSLITTETAADVGDSLSEPHNGPVLTLEQSVDIALSKNREMAAALNEIQALKGARIQAGLLPDPELMVEMENVAGTGGYTGTGLAETTIAFEQLIELGGKRKKRSRIADTELQLARYRYQSLERRIVAETTAGFFGVLAAQKRIVIAEKLFRLSTAFYKIVGERVNAGKVSPVEETRASVVLSTARIRLEKSRRDLAISRTRLATVMGGDQLSFERVIGELAGTIPVPDRTQLIELLSDNPEIAKWTTELERSRINLSLSKAGRVPDLALSAGYRKFRETDDSAYVIGVTLRLPVWNRNRGRIMEARSRAAETKETMAFSTNEVKQQFQMLYEELLVAVKEVATIQMAMLPASRSAFEAVRMGYQEGKFRFIEVLDAQRTYFNVELEYVDALARYHTLKAGVEAMTGQKLGDLNNPEVKNAETGEAGGTE